MNNAELARAIHTRGRSPHQPWNGIRSLRELDDETKDGVNSDVKGTNFQSGRTSRLFILFRHRPLKHVMK